VLRHVKDSRNLLSTNVMQVLALHKHNKCLVTRHSATDLQTELEQEALGQTSKTRKRLESQARAQFSGQSGITTGSLGRKRQV